MANDQIPSTEAGKLAFSQNFASKVPPYEALLNIPHDDVDDLNSRNANVVTARAQVEAAKTAYHGRVAEKDAHVGNMVDILRELIRIAQASPNMTDTIREELGLKKSSEEGSSNDTSYEEVPVLAIKSEAGRNIIHFKVNEPVSSRAWKPSWSDGCLIYRKKAGEANYQLLNITKRSPYIDYISGPATDYVYIARYQAKKPGITGGESSPVTVAGWGELPAAA